MKEIEKIEMLGVVEGAKISYMEAFLLKEINNTREKLNEITDIVNRLHQLQSVSENRDSKTMEMFDTFRKLEEEGYDVVELSLRQLGHLMGDIHPQTVKNYLVKYMREKLSKLKTKEDEK